MKEADTPIAPWQADLMASAIVFLTCLSIPAIFCSDVFCFDDPYYYWNMVDAHQVPGTQGAPVFLIMSAISGLFGSVWGIRITAALISALFFISMRRLFREIYSEHWLSWACALLAVLSFWWTQISMQLFKNELGLLMIVLFAYFFVRWRKTNARGAAALAAVSFFAAILCHASSGVYLLVSLSIFSVLEGARTRDLRLIAPGFLACAAFFLVNYILNPFGLMAGADSAYLASQSLAARFHILEYALLLIPAAISWKYGGGTGTILLPSFVLGSLLLGATGAVSLDWAWRFLLDGYWALHLLAAGCVFGIVNWRKSGAPSGFLGCLARLRIPAIICAIVFLQYVCMSALTLMILKPLYTHEDMGVLSMALAKYAPDEVLLLVSNWGLDQVIMRGGYSGSIGWGRCPAAVEPGKKVWLIRMVGSEGGPGNPCGTGACHPEGRFQFIPCQ